MQSRREFLRSSLLGATTLAIGGLGFPVISDAKNKGANDKIRVGVIGFSNRGKNSLFPCFMALKDELNFEIVAVADLWSVRREEARIYFKDKYNLDVKLFRNEEELFESKLCDAVIISTADFQHALHCAAAVRAGLDVYVEKPFAESMADARVALKAVQETGAIVQVGSQRRSMPNYQTASEYIKSGKFGKITMVEMCWNCNDPGRWRRPAEVSKCFEKDTDWKRWLLNRPYEPWDSRKYLEFRLFWPYSSGIPGQWMAHQIDTVNWFSGYSHPRSVVAGGDVYCWKDGRRNYDTVTAVLDYGNAEGTEGFQVLYSSRQHNSAGGTKELYFSNGGTLNLVTNEITSEGGLSAKNAQAMNMEANLLEPLKLPTVNVQTDANTGVDIATLNHMRNWMECVRSRKTPNAPAQAGYSHSIATIMCNAALRTGERAVFDEISQEVVAGGKVFQY